MVCIKKEEIPKDFPLCLIVRLKGLEPSRREALDPKSSVSTNFTTGA